MFGDRKLNQEKGCAVFIALVVGFPVLTLFLVIESCTRYSPDLVSPDGRFVTSSKIILGGALDDDSVIVKVKRNRWWSLWIFAKQVYSGMGGFDFQAKKITFPPVIWRDSSNLLISVRPSPVTRCAPSTLELEIVCEDPRFNNHRLY